MDAVASWMASNRLRLNPTKTEFMWCCTSRRLHVINDAIFNLPDGPVNASTSIRNLGAYFEQTLTLKDHVNHLVKSCFYQLRRIRSIRRALPTSAAILLVNSFVVSRVDYCNSILAGAPAILTDRVQSVLNAAARLIYGRGRFDHVTDVMRDRLHWLLVPQRIMFKCALLTYKAQNGLAPNYIARSCVLSSSLQTRYSLRSASHQVLAVPRCRTRFGERSFTFAGPTIWNNLPDYVKGADGGADSV